MARGTILLSLTRLFASIKGEYRRHLAATLKHSPQIISSVTLDVWFGPQNKFKIIQKSLKNKI